MIPFFLFISIHISFIYKSSHNLLSNYTYKDNIKKYPLNYLHVNLVSNLLLQLSLKTHQN